MYSLRLKKLISNRLVAISIAIALIVVLLASNISQAVVPGDNKLVSTDALGNQANNKSENPMISADGEFVAFESLATNLVPNDTNNKKDIFVKNLRTGEIKRISISNSGTEANNDSTLSAISETGRFIAFNSSATNLIDGQTFTFTHSYLYDTTLDHIELISRKQNGTPLSVAFMVGKTTSISSDGRFVTYAAHNNSLLAPGMTTTGGNGSGRVFMLDRKLNSWKLVDVTLNGLWQYDKTTGMPSTSCDGTLAVFYSTANNYVNGVTDSRGIYLADLRTGTPEISYIASATSSNASSLNVNPLISCTGSYITFSSRSLELVPEVTVGTNRHYYLYDRIQGKISLIDKMSSGDAAPDSTAEDSRANAYVTNIGNVAFMHTSMIGDLDANYSTPFARAYFRDVRDSDTYNLAKKANGTLALGPSQATPMVLSVASDGRSAVGVAVDQTGLIVGDSNGYQDIVLMKTGL